MAFNKSSNSHDQRGDLGRSVKKQNNEELIETAAERIAELFLACYEHQKKQQRDEEKRKA